MDECKTLATAAPQYEQQPHPPLSPLRTSSSSSALSVAVTPPRHARSNSQQQMQQVPSPWKRSAGEA
jgi:hypothetical protein